MISSVLLFVVVNVLVKVMAEIPTVQIVFIRSIISFALCSIYIIYMGIPFLGINRKWLIIRAVTGLTALTMYFYTVQNIPLATAVILQYLSPIFTVLISVFLLKQKVLLRQWTYLFAAFVGILLIKGFDERVSTLLLAIGILSAVFSSFAYNAIIKCTETDHPVTIVMYFHLISTPLMGVWSGFVWKPVANVEWIYLVIVGVFSVLAQIAMAYALKAESAARIMPIKYLGAIFAFVIGYFYFQESMAFPAIIGMLIVLITLVLNSRFKPRTKALDPN